MKKYSIFISGPAYNDIANITDYFILTVNDAETGYRIADKIFDAIASLEELPSRHNCFYKQLRAFPISGYLIFYLVEEDTVSVARVLHQRQEWERILSNL